MNQFRRLIGVPYGGIFFIVMEILLANVNVKVYRNRRNSYQITLGYQVRDTHTTRLRWATNPWGIWQV
jgi:hypothetical protein